MLKLPRFHLQNFESLLENPFTTELTAKEAFALSQHLHVPLHPKFTFFWSNLSSVQEVKSAEGLVVQVLKCQVQTVQFVRLSGHADQNVCLVLRKIFAPHRVSEGKICR